MHRKTNIVRSALLATFCEIIIISERGKSKVKQRDLDSRHTVFF